MIRNAILPALLIAGTFALPSVEAADQWGNLKGKFVYKGKAPAAAKLEITKDKEVCGKHSLVDESLVIGPEGGLANVVIYVRTKKVKVHPDYSKTDNDKVRFDNKHCRFDPHILPVRLTQTLELHNSDTVGHNSNLQPLGDVGTNPLIGPDSAADHKFSKVQNIPVPVSCNIHPWMKGYVVVRDNPYTAVTDEHGAFVLENLPVGKLEFLVWQEKAGYLEAKSDWKKGRFELEIKAGDNDLGTIEVNPKLFEKK